MQDKTGTITEGRPRVTDVEARAGKTNASGIVVPTLGVGSREASCSTFMRKV